MQYQRLFGGAEQLMLMKEPETDYGRSGEIPVEHADSDPGPASFQCLRSRCENLSWVASRQLWLKWKNAAWPRC